MYMTNIEKTQEKLYDIKDDPKENINIAPKKPGICKRLRKRIWAEAGGTLPIYDVIRQGHEWYEYPDIHDPTGTFSKTLIEKREAKKRK
jgi:hypothetical protein